MADTFTTNAILGGFTALIAATNFGAAWWLIQSVRIQIAQHRQHSRRGRSTAWIIFNRPAIRITVGFIIKTVAIAVIFGLRLPLRVLREAENLDLARNWLSWTVLWESTCSLALLGGIIMIMWPSFGKYAPWYATLPVVLVGCGVIFFLGVFLVYEAAPYFVQ